MKNKASITPWCAIQYEEVNKYKQFTSYKPKQK